MFSSEEILTRGKALTFDDVLLIPIHSEISSRRNPDLSTKLTKNFVTQIPVIASNMDTITEKEMVLAMAKLGGVGILHRFMELERQIQQIRDIKSSFNELGLKGPVAASIGVKEDGMKRAGALVEAGADILTIDIAHGDSIMMIETLDFVKNHFPHVDVIAGNVATGDSLRRLVDHGADAVKVGIGPGSMCTTRIITGCGLSQLTSVASSYQVAKTYGIPIIADGGMRNSGDIVKALCAGASTVMLGSMLSGTIETPGEVRGGKKKYRGMASKDAQVSWRGELPEGMAAEGEATLIACKGSVADVIHEITGGIRSGMTYLNAHEIKELYKNACFVEVSGAGLAESRPHGIYS